MPRNRRRKRSPSFEVTQVVSAGGVEVVSVDVVAGKTVKKRAFERVFFEVPAVPDDSSPSFDDDTQDSTPAATNRKGSSRSASVHISARVQGSYTQADNTAGDNPRMASPVRQLRGLPSSSGGSP